MLESLRQLTDPVYVVSAGEMRNLEAVAVEQGSSYEELMERAGQVVADFMLDWLRRREVHNLLVLVGPGNNGGDALVVARHLRVAGMNVKCRTVLREGSRDPRLNKPLAAQQVEILLLENVSDLDPSLAWADAVVDGLFGTGLQRDLTGLSADVVQAVNRAKKPVLSIDLPSGVDSDTGKIRGVAINASMTVALGHLKYGHILPPGHLLSGEIFIGDIGLNTQASRDAAKGELLNDNSVRKLLPERPEDGNKGTFGKAMVVAGSVNYIGAAVLAVQGAMRSGAGLITLGCPGDLLSVMAVKLTECTFLPLPSDLGSLAAPAADKVRAGLEGYDALLVGCGMGKEKETAGFLRRLLTAAESAPRTGPRSIGFATRMAEADEEEKDKESSSLPPLVLDGDGLNIVADWEDFAQSLPPGSVLTPHPGEMARLLGNTVEDVQADRAATAREAARTWKQVVVLKGAGTVISDQNGQVFVSPFSNPALATAGTGDVLAGVITGLIAQGLSPLDAACAGVYLHGMAGEMLREKYGPSGGLAGELPVLVARARRNLSDAAHRNAG